MEDQAKPKSTSLQMEQARQLLELGHHQEALALALDALLRELHNLRKSLKALEETVQADPPDTAEKEEQPAPYWVLEPKPRRLH
jgi:hypothetical protein